MKVLKSLSLLFVAVMISFGVNAQTATPMQETKSSSSTTKKDDGKGNTAKTETKSSKSETKGEAKPADKPAPKSADEKKGDGRTKTGDSINKDLKGPKGETVYTGPKGGNYYLSGSGSKVYLKK